MTGQAAQTGQAAPQLVAVDALDQVFVRPDQVSALYIDDEGDTAIVLPHTTLFVSCAIADVVAKLAAAAEPPAPKRRSRTKAEQGGDGTPSGGEQS